jgi:CRP/FNR family transcriptional regulator, cyclic AMP receptor protein
MSMFELDGGSQLLGYVASALVLTTFCFSNPVWLRIFALLSNVAFIAFGYVSKVFPVMLLHMILVPINSFQLTSVLRTR